jgi:hypothetical protein
MKIFLFQFGQKMHKIFWPKWSFVKSAPGLDTLNYGSRDSMACSRHLPNSKQDFILSGMPTKVWFSFSGVSNGLFQGCQMAYFQTKNPDLGKFGRSCDDRCWYIPNMDICSSLGLIRIFRGHLVLIMVIWYISPVLVNVLSQEKSGTPGLFKSSNVSTAY